MGRTRSFGLEAPGRTLGPHGLLSKLYAPPIRLARAHGARCPLRPPLQRRLIERIALLQAATLQPALEPFHALRAGAVGETFWHHGAA